MSILNMYQAEAQHGVCELGADKCQTTVFAFIGC